MAPTWIWMRFCQTVSSAVSRPTNCSAFSIKSVDWWPTRAMSALSSSLISVWSDSLKDRSKRLLNVSKMASDLINSWTNKKKKINKRKMINQPPEVRTKKVVEARLPSDRNSRQPSRVKQRSSLAPKRACRPRSVRFNRNKLWRSSLKTVRLDSWLRLLMIS